MLPYTLCSLFLPGHMHSLDVCNTGSGGTVLSIPSGTTPHFSAHPGHVQEGPRRPRLAMHMGTAEPQQYTQHIYKAFL